MILIALVGHSSTHFPMPSHFFVDRNMTITFLIFFDIFDVIILNLFHNSYPLPNVNLPIIIPAKAAIKPFASTESVYHGNGPC